MNSSKLELTWTGKYLEKKVEPRIIIEDVLKSNIKYDVNTDNMLIHGDNLLALKALEHNYANKIKCIYIDPPYNTGNAFEHYDDGLEHSIWLNLMRDRLVILRRLLRNDGFIAIQIDDNEHAYLKIMCDEIFGRSNFVNSIAVKMSEPSGVKMAHAKKRFPKLKEYILIYSKTEGAEFSDVVTYRENTWDKENNIILLNLSREDREILKKIEEQEINKEDDVILANSILSKVKIQTLSAFLADTKVKIDDEYLYSNSYRIIKTAGASGLFKLVQTFENIPEQDIAAGLSKTGILFFYITKFNREAKQPRLQVIFADTNIYKNPGDFWQDIKTTGAIANEGGVSLPNGKKPEKLIMRVLQTLSNPGDIVLDSFLGSGTTAAVAHKMNRIWIGIEIGNQAYTHCIPRLDNVIKGDQTGISKELNWTGGGGYRFYELAPSLLVKHETLPIYQVNKEYSFEMLCEAICKLEGFKYQPEGEMHGRSSESRFIHISSELISGEYIKNITKELGENDSVIIYGSKIQSNLKLPDNIEVKRIPKDLLKKYDFESEVR